MGTSGFSTLPVTPGTAPAGGAPRHGPRGGCRLIALRSRLLLAGAPLDEEGDGGDDHHRDEHQDDPAVPHCRPLYFRPSARRSCARADASCPSAWIAWAAACVTATCASPSSIALPTPTAYRCSARSSLTFELVSASWVAEMLALAARTAKRAESTSVRICWRSRSSCATMFATF